MSSLVEKHWARQYDKSISALSDYRQECPIKLGSLPHLDELKLHQQGACSSLHLPDHLPRRRLAVDARMPEGGNARDGGKGLFEQLQPAWWPAQDRGMSSRLCSHPAARGWPPGRPRRGRPC